MYNLFCIVLHFECLAYAQLTTVLSATSINTKVSVVRMTAFTVFVRVVLWISRSALSIEVIFVYVRRFDLSCFLKWPHGYLSLVYLANRMRLRFESGQLAS